MKTSEFIVRRILLLIPVMIGVTVFTFAIAQIIPADPAAILCGERCGLIDPVTGKTMLELQRERLGLDKPVIKSHGSTDSLGFCNSLRVCEKTIKGQLIDKIKENIN